MRIPKRSVVVILATLLVTIAASAAFATQPNDPLISQQSNMYVIHAGGSGGSWDRGGVGDGSAFVAVLSTGIDYNHEDLFSQMFRNLPGCPAGTVGYNAITHSCFGTLDDSSISSGTALAGVGAARAFNAKGISGVAQNLGIINIKVLNSAGSPTANYQSIIDGIDKVVAVADSGYKVSSIVIGFAGTTPSTALQGAIARANTRQITVVAAAGDSGVDVSTSKRYPCTYADICVAATTDFDQRASFSNFSTSIVDMAAPGVSVFTTFRNNQYGRRSGTGMAAAQVAATVALTSETKNNCRFVILSIGRGVPSSGSDVVGPIGVTGNRRLNVLKELIALHCL